MFAVGHGEKRKVVPGAGKGVNLPAEREDDGVKAGDQADDREKGEALRKACSEDDAKTIE